MTQTARRPDTTESRATTALRAFQVLAALTVLELLVQYLTAGQMLGPVHDHTAREVHETGAVVLHVLSGLTTIAAVVLWRRRRTPLWPALLSAVVFVLTFVQAYLGDDETLYLHVPGALILTVGSVWLLAWSFTPRAGVAKR
jgi:uncharacterized membrane protein YozB (DUF420 family)